MKLNSHKCVSIFMFFVASVLSSHSYAANCFRSGDADGNGSVNPADVQLIYEFYFGIKTPVDDCQKQRADIDGDGMVSPDDLVCANDFYYKKPSCAKLGDVDFNGIVNSADWDLVSKHISKTLVFNSMQIQRGDVNRDGVVDSRDKYCVQSVYTPTSSTGKSRKHDINMDGDTNEADYLILNDFYLGKVVAKSYPCIYILGDMDYNGNIDPSDVQKLYQFVTLTKKK